MLTMTLNEEPGSVVRDYVIGVDPESAAMVLALDEAVRGAGPGFDVAMKYHIVTYALAGDWRHWVCALDAGRDRGAKGVSLRFLYGVLLADPAGVLRPGSSTLMTWDLRRGQEMDLAQVAAYVREAVGLYPDYRARSKEITEAARAAAADRGTRRRR